MSNNFRSEDDRYNDIRKATLDTMEEKCFDKYFKDTGKRWLDIARVWDALNTGKMHLVLTFAIHSILWGAHPKTLFGASFETLIELVKEEILRDGEAFKAWSKWRTFNNVFDTVINAKTTLATCPIDVHFVDHYNHLEHKALYEVFYSKSGFIATYPYEEAIKGYEDAIKLLVPESVSWSRAQWGNDLVLAGAINQLYGVDYSLTDDSQKDFERIVGMINNWNKSKFSADTVWNASNITTLPWEIVKRIWPDNTANILADMLIKGYGALSKYEKAGSPFKESKKYHRHPYGHFDRHTLKNSWLNTYVYELYNKGEYTGRKRDAVRKIIFDLATTC